MAQGAVQINTRIDAQLKRGGDAVFLREGLTPSEVVRGVWGYAQERQEVPPDVLSFIRSDDRATRLDLARRGAGLAVRTARERCGLSQDVCDMVADALDYEALRDEMYDELLARMDEQCR